MVKGFERIKKKEPYKVLMRTTFETARYMSLYALYGSK